MKKPLIYVIIIENYIIYIKSGANLFKFNQIFEEEKILSLSGVTLAFVGDAVYSLYVREKLAYESTAKSGELNKMASQIVCAKAQANRIDEIFDELTEDEKAVFLKARNAKKGTKAKNASVGEYNKATGFEALVGYLYLTGKYERLDFLLNLEKKDEN